MELTRWALERPAVDRDDSLLSPSSDAMLPWRDPSWSSTSTVFASSAVATHGGFNDLVHVVRGWREQLDRCHPTDVTIDAPSIRRSPMIRARRPSFVRSATSTDSPSSARRLREHAPEPRPGRSGRPPRPRAASSGLLGVPRAAADSRRTHSALLVGSRAERLIHRWDAPSDGAFACRLNSTGRTEQRGHLVSTPEPVRNNGLHGDKGDADYQPADEAGNTVEPEELRSRCWNQGPGGDNPAPTGDRDARKLILLDSLLE